MASIQYPHDRGRAGEKGELSNAPSIERVSPNTVSIGHMSRRGFLALPLLCSSVLAFPGIAQADSVDVDSITYYARPDLTIEEFEAFVQQQTEAEAAKVIEDAMLQTQTESILPRGGRPTYSTVYGSKTIKTTGVKDAGGQPSGGYGYTNPGGRLVISNQFWWRVCFGIRESSGRTWQHRSVTVCRQQDFICYRLDCEYSR